jgi:hypothetical protein
MGAGELRPCQADAASGYGGLPLQQTCPHPNACLTCDSFLTTTEFLPAHRDQLTRTEQLIAQARADGRTFASFPSGCWRGTSGVGLLLCPQARQVCALEPLPSLATN